ncbi:hypothetical protein F4775DRAFT_56902 [Biscogniauxia sp. FL1348]|nr:hypothetical protein F4775DRAFT_56902 [Biscogniauxia sp. FL1348]
MGLSPHSPHSILLLIAPSDQCSSGNKRSFFSLSPLPASRGRKAQGREKREINQRRAREARTPPLPSRDRQTGRQSDTNNHQSRTSLGRNLSSLFSCLIHVWPRSRSLSQMDEAEAAAAAAAQAEAQAEATCTSATNASPPITANTIVGDDADRVVGATAAATGAATVVAASAAGAVAGVITSGFSTSTKKRTNSNNTPATTLVAAAAGEAASPSPTNEKRSQQLMLARERGGPRFFGPCPVVNSDAIWDEICICHQSAQYHLAEYSRLYRSLHMTPTNFMPTVAAEDDIDLDSNHNNNKIVRVEDLSSSPDAWRLKVERDFAMRDLRVVRDRLEVVAGARPRLSRGAVSLSAIS